MTGASRYYNIKAQNTDLVKGGIQRLPTNKQTSPPGPTTTKRLKHKDEMKGGEYSGRYFAKLLHLLELKLLTFRPSPFLPPSFNYLHLHAHTLSTEWRTKWEILHYTPPPRTNLHPSFLPHTLITSASLHTLSLLHGNQSGVKSPHLPATWNSS